MSVKDPVGPPIPMVRQPSKDGGKIGPSVGGQQSSDVLDNHPTGSDISNEPSELVPESRPFASEASTLACDADVLTWEPSDDGVGSESNKLVCSDIGHVLPAGHVGPPLL